MTAVVSRYVGPVTTAPLTMATGRVLGRTTAGTGAIEELAALPGVDGSALTGVQKTAGQTLCRWVAQSGVSPAANGATFDARNGHPVFDFDDATDESTIFSGTLPKEYAGGGVKVEIHYAMTSATSGKIAWDAAFERVSDSQQDIDSDGFAATNRVNVAAVPGTSGYVAIAEVTFTDGADMDSVAAGEGFRLKITRVPSDTTNDTASGDAELWAVEVREAG